MTSPADLAALLRRGRFSLSTEAEAQADIEGFLTGHGISFEREFRLTKEDRLDFLVDGGIVIEVKMNRTSPAQIAAQVARYARHEKTEAVILVSNRALVLPPTIEGKPAFFVSMGRAWL